MDSSPSVNSKPTKSIPGTMITKPSDSISQMGLIKLTVKDYMSSLHTYMETPPVSRWDNLAKPDFRYPKSIQDLLKLCEADPVELLIDLGFGIEEPDLCTKIPSRFIMNPSEAKGINIRVFLEAQRKRMDIENPNLCGRFRQLEVLEQVTNAFSSLLNDVHTLQNGHEVKDKGKSTLTQEKRKRIRQLLWKFSKHKLADKQEQVINQCPNTTEPSEKQDDLGAALKDMSNTKGFRKTKRRVHDIPNLKQMPPGYNIDSIHVHQKEDNPLSTKRDTSKRNPVKQHSLPAELPSKSRTYRDPKILSRTCGRTPGQQVRHLSKTSLDIEEVASIDEEYLKTCSTSDMARTNSCQSDSSGFQDEPPESSQNGLRNIIMNSDSTDSQATLMENNYSLKGSRLSHNANNQAIDIGYRNIGNTSSNSNALQTSKENHRVFSISSQTSNEEFQSFESHNEGIEKYIGNQTKCEKMLKVGSEEIESGNREAEDEMDDNHDCSSELQEHNDISEVDFPVYITHYLSKSVGRYNTYDLLNDGQMQGNTDGSVSDLKNKGNKKNGQLSKNVKDYLDSSVEVSGMESTSFTALNELHSLSSPLQALSGSPENRDEETNCSSKDPRNTFQTELSTNIYKSVTIQMSSSLMSDTQKTYPGEYLNRQHSFYSMRSETNQEDVAIKNNIEIKDVYCQTDLGWWHQSCTNNHCTNSKHFQTESHSFDTGLCGLYHPCHATLPPACRHCCHYCHCHHCCFSGFSSYHNQSASMRPNLIHNSIEKDLSDTLALLKESLSNLSLNTDRDMEKMKKECQRFRDQLLEMEQRLTEQQAGCFYTLSDEDREEIRRLYLLRRSVLREVSELEFHLDERARNVKETISMQLELVLDEQSKLYSELELCNWEQERRQLQHYDSTKTTSSFTSSASANYDINENAHAPILKPNEMDQTETSKSQTQKTDFIAILENIKKAFRNFNNS
ncbi:coiled-coil domain-containing 129 isoform X1 [Pelobates cultripes]|uniref:Coiled-coil domain-containing 129 isoform X1 n=2 Tax=Pelobates cultripes TaxID=61616 RepID=A0AAD1RXT5_PELCU|nr:coiled-coil domain-containing 129 isoform X1 [Pelobates cultripes]